MDYSFLVPRTEGGNKSISKLQLHNTGVTFPTGRLEGLRKRFSTEKTQSCPPGETKPILTTTQHGKLGSPGVRSVHHFFG